MTDPNPLARFDRAAAAADAAIAGVAEGGALTKIVATPSGTNPADRLAAIAGRTLEPAM